MHERESRLHTAAADPRGHSDSATQGNPIPWRERLAYQVRTRPRERLNNLAHHITEELILERLAAIPKKSAPGVDGLSVKQVIKHRQALLKPVLRSIHAKSYEAPPVRRVYIPKADGSKRPLGVPTVLDRAVQKISKPKHGSMTSIGKNWLQDK